jgi:hypothetical protein
MQLEMIPCPKCGNDFPKKRKELGYHVCINCSTVKPKVAITTVEGEGDHTYNDIIIMDQDQAMAIARKAAELSGMRADLEVIDFDTEADENEVSQSIKDQVTRIVEDDEEHAPISCVEDTPQGVEGIDY